MASLQLVAPELEPVSAQEIKSFLRIEHDDDDILLSSLISAARGHIEALTRRFLITQTWRFIRDEWPQNGNFSLRCGPVQQLVAARVFDHAQIAHAIDDELFIIDKGANAIAAPAFALPAPGRARAGIELDVRLGFGAASDVPKPLLQAIRMLATHWYENRGIIAIGGQTAMIPLSVQAMVGPYRVVSL